MWLVFIILKLAGLLGPEVSWWWLAVLLFEHSVTHIVYK